MSNDIIHSKIELLEEQIENFERSGYFTESEINRFSSPLREELESLKKQINLYGMEQEEYNEGKRIHQLWFMLYRSPALINTHKHFGIDFGMNLTSTQG